MSVEQGTTWDARPPPDRGRAAWVAVSWDRHRDVVELPKGVDVSIGRSRSSGIPIVDPAVSRLHATLRWDGDQHVILTDHGSRNGVFLRGGRVHAGATLSNGDELRVGPAQILVVVPPLDDSTEDDVPFAVDPAMDRVLVMADRAAQSDLPVLILGETGVGKELLAKRIHERSARAEGPFVATNCGTITESLAESILFGHERGAFTGADQRRGGLFEAATGGTLFLDEVGELSLTNQARLLRVLEDKRITRVGATDAIDVDVRVVAATHRDLEKMVRDARFRRDLLYRIDVLHVTVPPLRERPADVVWLAQRFVAEHGRALSLDDSALTLLRGHGWPGNVRELKNAVARASAMRSRDVLTAKDFELDRPSSAGGGPLHGHVADAERQAIETALEMCGGNQTRAAKRLGVSRRALIYKMEKHGLKALPPSKRYEPDGSK